MGAPVTNSIINIPGDLIVAPVLTAASIAAGFPYGGTQVGTTYENEFNPNPIYDELWFESPGVIGDVVYGGERPVFKCILAYPDNDAIQQFLPYSVAGSSGNYRKWGFGPAASPAWTPPGTFLSSTSLTILFSPHARTAHPALYMYNAIVLPDVAARIRMNWNTRYELALAFWGSIDTSGRDYIWANVGDIPYP